MRSSAIVLLLVALALGVTGAALAPAADSLVDPALKMGVLPNGLRYYIRASNTPAKRAELRLVVNAGSTQEDDDQQGFAHFLEHMAFNGTTNFPQQQLIDFVETSGMRFGADLNAYTSFDETVYMLTVPTDDAMLVAKGLTVLQDWASGGIVIDSAEVVAERGVVLGEWRSRMLDTLSEKIRDHQNGVLYGPGARYLKRFPIGDPKLLETAGPGPLKRFYKDWYRPDLMAVVVVGDIDPQQIEGEIKRRFGAIPAAKQPRPRGKSTLPSANAPVVDIYRGLVNATALVLWPVPAPSSDAKEAYRQLVVAELLQQQLERWFLNVREQRSRAFAFGGPVRAEIARPLEVFGFQFTTWPDSLERGLATVLTELERMAQHGIPEATLARRKAALLRRLEHEAASAGVRSSKIYAHEYAQHYLTGDGPLLAAEQELALAKQILPTITPAVLAKAARAWRSTEGRKVLLQLHEFSHVRPPTRKSVLALFDSVARTKLTPEPATARAGRGLAGTDTPLMEVGATPGRVVKEVLHQAAGLTEWTLSNGARVLVKPTRNDPDEVLLKAWSPGGFSLVPDSLFFSTGRMVARMMTDAAGLGTHNRDDLIEKLSTTGVRNFAVDIGFADEAIALAGSPRELETLFQMLHLQFTQPKLDTAALSAWQNYAKYQGRDYTIYDWLNQIFARGNSRLEPISTQLAELAKLEDAMAVYRHRFGNAGDFTFTLVGAFTAEQVKPLVERYLASLPATSEREAPGATEVRPFVHTIEGSERVMPIQRADVLLVFDGEFPRAPDEYFAQRERLSALNTVLTGRLRTRLREELGGTYGAQVTIHTYALPEERYRVVFNFSTAPGRMFEMRKALEAVLDTVRNTEVTAAELSRAAAIQRRQIETALQSNQYWLAAIGQYARLGLPFDKIPAPYDGVVAPGELRAAAQRFMPHDFYIRLTRMPSDTTWQFGKDSTGGAGSGALALRKNR
jgi:zinc protease